jgi:Flp pilus assembly protein TadD
MLVISRSHRLIFLHVPKCGGTSISSALAPLSDVPVPEYRAHATLDECLSLIGDDDIRSFRKVMVVRNTWDRIESGYWHQLREPMIDVNAYVDVRDNGFQAFVRRYAKQNLGTQDRWLYYRGERQAVEIIRFDALAEGIAQFCDQIGFTCSLDWLNRTDGRSHGTIYTPETVALVRRIFVREISEFQFGEPTLPEPDSRDEAALRTLSQHLVASSDATLDQSFGHPASALDFARIADAACVRGNLAAAAEAYRRAHELEPVNPWHLYARAMSLRRLGQIAEAFEAVTTALALSPDFPEALHEKALLQSTAGDDAGAMATLEQAIRSNPGQATLHHALSFSLMRLNCIPDAIAAAERALLLDPDLAPAHLHLGFLCLGTNQEERALHEMSAAADRAPEDPDTHYGRSCALLAVGEVAGARCAILTALGLRPDEPQYIQQLASLDARMACQPETERFSIQPPDARQ